jgi:hypothetical protein
MSHLRLIVIALAASALPVHLACTDLECGVGTIERDGECVGSNQTVDTANCGEGTIPQGPNCIGATTCGPGTTEQPGPDNTIVCRATGGGSLPACSQPLDCSSPGDATSICGRLYDLETDATIESDVPPALCPAELTADGPCSINVQFYDAVFFASNMGNTAELAYDKANLVRDTCGRFAVSGLPAASRAVTAVGARPAASDTTRRLTGVVAAVAQGQQANNVRLYSMRTSTDMAWSTSAGLPSGTFASRGVYVNIFTRQGTPVAGVTATYMGATRPDSDYYFSDAAAGSRTTVAAAQTATGANGVSLLTAVTPIAENAFGGTGGSCTYAPISGGTIAGVVFVQPRPDCQ